MNLEEPGTMIDPNLFIPPKTFDALQVQAIGDVDEGNLLEVLLLERSNPIAVRELQLQTDLQ